MLHQTMCYQFKPNEIRELARGTIFAYKYLEANELSKRHALGMSGIFDNYS